MVKFSNGMWWNRDGVHIDWAVEVVKPQVEKDSIRCVATSKHVNHRGDTLNTPTITIRTSSPAPHIALITASHWKSQTSTQQGPDYELFPDVDLNRIQATHADDIKTSLTDNQLSLRTSTISVQIDTRPSAFNIDVISHANRENPTSTTQSTSPDLLLTKLGWRSIGYVKENTTALNPSAALTNPDQGERWMTMQFQLSVGEKIYGLGERFGPFVKNGQAVEMWNEDAGTSSEKTYKNVPFLLSSRGYGIFVPDSGRVSFEVQSERTTRINIAVPSEKLSTYLIHGPTPKAILENYTLLTGRAALPPPWTFGLWLSTSFTTQYNEQTVNEFLEGMAKRDIGVGVFHFDCFWQKGFEWCDYEFDKEYFPDAVGQLRRLKEKGYKICVWLNPYIAQESSIFDEGAKNGYFIKKPDGSIWQIDYWQAGMGIIDFTNPDACTWYQSKLNKLIDMGVECFKTDFGERIPTGSTVYHNTNYSVEKMHNFYAYLYNKVTFEVLEKRLGKNKAVVFARSATAGCQRFPVHWGGDPMSTYEAMAETLRGGLSLGTSGFGYWAHDIGGFEGKPDPGLYKRWFAFGSLSSHSRLHGSGSYRVPWIIDPSGSSDTILRQFVSLKLSLMPYLYATAISTHQTGTPMMRPLFFEFPEDRNSWTIDEAYMLGENLYVAPVFSGSDADLVGSGGYSAAGSSFAPEDPTATKGDEKGSAGNEKASVQVYIPPGDWFSILTGEFFTGPSWSVQHHGYDSIPLLLRPGRAIALSAGAPTDSYFDERGVWKLRDLNETSGDERAWRGDGEWSARGAEYDFADKVTILVNASQPVDDVKVVIPDSRDEKLGQSAAEVRVYGNVEKGKIYAEVVIGEMKGEWRLVVVGKGLDSARSVVGQGKKLEA
ncbi:hypothetical protein D9756_008052 [Leucocoprinus leucothites]|uniref:alpha-D-xyloside xylohydrolase n=1 Tax=Leucocoprinus leucothites TaxID=201217 RepID=A0A8H5FXV7_9AGAR|nr:hypothetical protein D9756_008052 [Leucoagaricus leucothites]